MCSFGPVVVIHDDDDDDVGVLCNSQVSDFLRKLTPARHVILSSWNLVDCALKLDICV